MELEYGEYWYDDKEKTEAPEENHYKYHSDSRGI